MVFPPVLLSTGSTSSQPVASTVVPAGVLGQRSSASRMPSPSESVVVFPPVLLPVSLPVLEPPSMSMVMHSLPSASVVPLLFTKAISMQISAPSVSSSMS